MRAPRDPKIGWDVAGEVDAIGTGATRWKPGDAVMADLANHGGGSFAEYVVAKEDAFGTLPKGMDFVQASTLPHSAVLALQGLRTRNGRTPKAGTECWWWAHRAMSARSRSRSRRPWARM